MNPKTKLPEAKTFAEDDGTKATLAFRKSSHLFFRFGNVALASVLFCAFILPGIAAFTERSIASWGTTTTASSPASSPFVRQEASLPETEFPMSNLPFSKWPKLQMAAGTGSKTVRIPVPPGMRVLMNGDAFRYNCVYADGTEKSFGAGEKDCAYGPMLYVYASNLSPDPNVIAYAYQNIDR